MEQVDENQNFTNRKSGISKGVSSMMSQHEALRRATLLKHRKVSTQLKLDMVQRQLSNLRRSTMDSTDNDRQFYRLQMTELSNELQDLGSTLDKVERNSFYARKRMLRHCGIDYNNCSTIPLSSSHPAIYSSTENLSRSASRNSLKAKVCHLMSSPTEKFKKRHFFGELRAAASLSSLNTKSSSPSSCEDDHPSKDSKPWKAPLRFLGNLVDTRFRRRFWGSTSRTKSVDNILEDQKTEDCCNDNKDCNGIETSEVEVFSSSSSSSESEDEEVEEWRTSRTVPRYAVKGPVVRKISSHQKVQVDPAILAEIEDFERMAATYIKQHS